MKTLYYYCYYKMSKFYDELGQHLNWDGKAKDGHILGSLVLFGSFGFYFLSLLMFILYLFNKRMYEMHEILIFNERLDIILILGVPIVAVILSFLFINKKKYKELEEKYKDEKHRKLKGWLIFLYLICSLVLYIIAVFLWS